MLPARDNNDNREPVGSAEWKWQHAYSDTSLPKTKMPLYGTVAEAESTLGFIIERFRARGYSVAESDGNTDGMPWHPQFCLLDSVVSDN